MEKKLFRNEHDKMIAGIASGLADYLQIEVTIIRLLFALSTIFLAGSGLIAYVIMWVILPVNDDPATKFSKFNQYFDKNNTNKQPFGNAQTNPNWTQPINDEAGKTPFETQANFKFNKSNDTGRTIGGLFLLVIGCYFLMRQFDFIPDWIRFRNFWPLILIALGISIIAKAKRKNDWKSWPNQQTTEEKRADTITDSVVMDHSETKNDDYDLTVNNPKI